MNKKKNILIVDVLANVYSNGKVIFTPPALINAACKIDISNFPFDEKNCTLLLSRFYFNSYNFNFFFSL
jgi:nicotinic acetylcholine receptor beta-1